MFLYVFMYNRSDENISNIQRQNQNELVMDIQHGSITWIFNIIVLNLLNQHLAPVKQGKK